MKVPKHEPTEVLQMIGVTSETFFSQQIGKYFLWILFQSDRRTRTSKNQLHMPSDLIRQLS